MRKTYQVFLFLSPVWAGILAFIVTVPTDIRLYPFLVLYAGGSVNQAMYALDALMGSQINRKSMWLVTVLAAVVASSFFLDDDRLVASNIVVICMLEGFWARMARQAAK